MVYHDSVFSDFATKKIEKCPKMCPWHTFVDVRGIPRPWYTTGCGIPQLWYTIGVRLKDYSKTMVYHGIFGKVYLWYTMGWGGGRGIPRASATRTLIFF